MDNDMNYVAISMRGRLQRKRRRIVASYELTFRAENHHALLLVDIRRSAADDLDLVTSVEVSEGHLEVTFVARKAAAAAAAAGSQVGTERVSLRSDAGVNVSDGNWHRVDIARYLQFYYRATQN